MATFAVTAGALGAAATHAESRGFTDDRDAFVTGAAVSGGVVAVFLGVTTYGLAARNGTPSDHNITKYDAELYVARYNRALLRKTVRDTQSQMRRLSAVNEWQLAPIVSPGFLGIRGAF